jgi:ribosome-associated protein
MYEVSIPLTEVQLRTSRSSGPGGQHANVTASRVEALFDVRASASLSDAQRERLTARFGPVIRAVAQDARSQACNRELALDRLEARIIRAGGAGRVRRQRRLAPRRCGASRPSAGAACVRHSVAGRPTTDQDATAMP